MSPSAIAATATAAALALASCPALAGPLEELAGGVELAWDDEADAWRRAGDR